VRADIVRKKNVILNLDMSRKRHLVGEDVVVTDHAVVSDVYSHHEEVARADARCSSFPVGAMKSAILAYDVVVANLEIARLAFELYILRLAADYGVFKDAIPGAEASVSLDDSIGRNLAIWADFNVILDDGRGVDGHFLTELQDLQGFQDNRVLWILQILFMMLGCYLV